jgi:hypothetical protein
MQPVTNRLTSIIGTYHLASEQERIQGLQWYPKAYTAALALSAAHQVSAITVAGVIAALSPNNAWKRNLTDAEALIGTYHRDGAYTASQLKVCTYGVNLQKALTILKLTNPTIEDVATVLHGRKVSSFFRCILGSHTDVCVDGHAYSIWAGQTIPTSKTPKISPRLYEQIARDYTQATTLIHSRTPSHELLSPVALQAITWVTHRRMLQQ